VLEFDDVVDVLFNETLDGMLVADEEVDAWACICADAEAEADADNDADADADVDVDGLDAKYNEVNEPCDPCEL